MKKRKSDLPAPIPMPKGTRSLIGCRFGRLSVRFYAGQDKHGKSHWCCKCDCGNYCRVPGSRLLGRERHGGQVSCGCARADPEIRRAARLKVPKARRVEICRKMRESVKHRSPAYSLSADRAAELLGVSLERIHVLSADGKIGSVMRKNRLYVSSADVAAMIAESERQAKRCPIRALLKGAKQ